MHEPSIPLNPGDAVILNKENLVLIVGYSTKYSIVMSIYICGDHSAYVFNVWGIRILSDYLFFLIIMPILELIIELLDSFTFPNPNTTEWITDDFPKEFLKT